jgi:crossover junction endodeoxyribonuclease RusA
MYVNAYIKGRRMKILKTQAKAWVEDTTFRANQWMKDNQWSTATEKTIVRLWFYFPDKRRRDTHNGLKVLLDALEDAGIYEDDKFALPQIIDFEYDKNNPRIEIEFEKIKTKSEAEEILSKAKRIPNYPDYYITKEGQVYSTRNSRDGKPKPIKTRANGSVTLCRGTQSRKQAIVRYLVKQMWGVDMK